MNSFRNQLGRNGDREVNVQQVADAIASDSHTVVDVRELDEWQDVHIAGAVHIPLVELGARAVELPAGKPIYTVCHVGVRSLFAVQILDRLGLDGARSLAGGMDAWVAAGEPIVR